MLLAEAYANSFRRAFSLDKLSRACHSHGTNEDAEPEATMAEFRLTITINRPREEVFDYLIDPDTQTVWQSGLQHFEADWQGRQPEVGDRAKGTTKVAGRNMRWETETTEFDYPAKVTFRSVEAPFSFEISYTLADRDGATEVSHQGSTGSTGGFFGKLADPLVARMYQRDMNSNMENVKSILEET